MSNYDNTNTGIISKNDRKEKDTHPDIKGQINVEGVEYFINGWLKERKNGAGKFYSLAIKRKEEQAKPTTKPQAQPDFDESDIPFN